MTQNSLLMECLQIYGTEENTINFIKNTTSKLENNTYKCWKKVRRGQYQESVLPKDSLSPLLFVPTMIPMTRVLHKMEVEYQLKKGGGTINHLISWITPSCSEEVPRR